jgi:hypothetical protein
MAESAFALQISGYDHLVTGQRNIENTGRKDFLYKIRILFQSSGYEMFGY